MRWQEGGVGGSSGRAVPRPQADAASASPHPAWVRTCGIDRLESGAHMPHVPEMRHSNAAYRTDLRCAPMRNGNAAFHTVLKLALEMAHPGPPSFGRSF